MKKLLTLVVVFVSLQTFAATETEIDNFWALYSQSTLELSAALSRIRSSNNFNSSKTVVFEAFSKRKAMFEALNINQNDSQIVLQRYNFHVQNRTSIGIKIITATQKFSAEYQRIGALPGGKEFLQSIFKRPAVPSQ